MRQSINYKLYKLSEVFEPTECFVHIKICIRLIVTEGQTSIYHLAHNKYYSQLIYIIRPINNNA